jgi:glutaredoxin
MTLITRKDCLYCNQAKSVLQENSVEYEELIIGETITRDEVIAKYPDQKLLPIVVVDGNAIGTYGELLDYLFPAKKD